MGMKRQESGGTFEPCPEGQYAAVLADIIDLGWQERIFEGQSQGLHPMVKLVWQVNEDNSEGKPFVVFDRKMKYSFHEKSALYGRLCAWLGKKKVEQMIADDAEIESLIGFSAFIAVEHSQGTDGTTYANISTIMPLPKGMRPLSVRDYERWCERDSWENADDRGNPPRKPEYSAFDDPATVRRQMAEAAGQQTMDVKPQPTPTAPPASAPITDAPITDLTRQAILAQAVISFGDKDYKKKLKSKLTKPIEQYTEDEGCKLLDALRQMKPALPISEDDEADDGWDFTRDVEQAQAEGTLPMEAPTQPVLNTAHA